MRFTYRVINLNKRHEDMAKIKDAYKRICLIDSAIRSLHYPSKERIIEHVCDGLSEPHDAICVSSIEKDIHYMRFNMEAPIYYNKMEKGYQYIGNYNFVKAFFRYWSIYIEFPKEIYSYIYDE